MITQKSHLIHQHQPGTQFSMILNLHAHPTPNPIPTPIPVLVCYKEYNEQLVMSAMRGQKERNRIWVTSSFPSPAMEHTDGALLFFSYT